jgi:hypothetical protein
LQQICKNRGFGPAKLAENITFFDYALHRVPKNLRKTSQEAIDSIEQPAWSYWDTACAETA